MDQNRTFPIPAPLSDTLTGMVRHVDYAEDGITTTATATLDNGMVLTGSHSFLRAKHFSVHAGRARAFDDVVRQAGHLLRFRQLDAIAVAAHAGYAAPAPLGPDDIDPPAERVKLRELIADSTAPDATPADLAAAAEASTGVALDVAATESEAESPASTEESTHEQP